MVNLEILETDRELELVRREGFYALWLINGNDERLYVLGTGGRWIIAGFQDSPSTAQFIQALGRQAERG